MTESLAHFGRVLVVSPHPDDEVLGCGGTISRLTRQGIDVSVALVTTGQAPQFSAKLVAQLSDERARAHDLLGVSRCYRLGLPAAGLDTVPAADRNEAMAQVFHSARPDTVFVPFVGDIHGDHQLSFEAAMVAARPRDSAAPRRILAYETLSETNWYAPPATPAFIPNCFVDISDDIERKIAAFACFESQVKAFPDERSFETIRSLAALRGSTVYRRAAEGFMVVRQVE